VLNLEGGSAVEIEVQEGAKSGGYVRRTARRHSGRGSSSEQRSANPRRTTPLPAAYRIRGVKPALLIGVS
jgi:hypothetical protein